MVRDIFGDPLETPWPAGIRAAVDADKVPQRVAKVITYFKDNADATGQREKDERDARIAAEKREKTLQTVITERNTEITKYQRQITEQEDLQDLRGLLTQAQSDLGRKGVDLVQERARRNAEQARADALQVTVRGDYAHDRLYEIFENNASRTFDSEYARAAADDIVLAMMAAGGRVKDKHVVNLASALAEKFGTSSIGIIRNTVVEAVQKVTEFTYRALKEAADA